MSRPQGRLRAPPSGLRGFSKPAPKTTKGGFGGFATAQSKSGLAYVAERSDLSAISDANAVISFKNLLKKDGTTKARALEDLVVYAQAHPHEAGGVEEAVLEAWVQYYPRLSIDDSRKVRELAHALQLELMKSARKRMERHLPKVAGPWLAGTYDRDRAVSRAAADGLASFLTTDDKARLFWQRLQPQILDYATAALEETPTTLSDMRSSSQEDADLKHHRVLYSSLSLVLALLRRLAVADTDPLGPAYEQFFAVEAVWSSALSVDSHVRRAAYELFLQCLETRPAFLEAQLPRLTKLLTQDAPKTNQSGSVVAYVGVLKKLSETHPEIWSEGKHPFTRLRPLVEKGSQGTASTASYNFWQQLDALFASIPAGTIAADAAKDVLVSFRNGVSNREEPLSNAVDGWTAYLSMVRRLVDAVTPEDARVGLVEANVYPLLDHFMQPPSKAKAVWVTSAHIPVLTRASLLVSRPAYPDIVDSARREWAQLASNFAGRMANSLPEVSKAFQQSQQDIANEGDRWFSLVADIHRSVQQVHAQPAGGAATPAPANLVEDILEQPTLSLLRSAVDLLRKRNYKPSGAAQFVAAAFAHAPHLLRGSDGQAVVALLFPVDDADQLAVIPSSPSAAPLLSCLRSMASIPEFRAQYESVYAAIVALLLADEDADVDATAKSIALLISDASEAALATSRRNDGLQRYLVSACLATAQGRSKNWDLFNAVFASNALGPAAGKALASRIVRCLGSSDTDTDADADADPQSVLTALETIASRAPDLLVRDEAVHMELVTRLLGMMEVRDAALSAKVLALRALVDRSHQGGGEPPLFKIIQDNLDSAGPDSLEIDTLVDQASGLAKTATADDMENLFPNTNVWMQDMQAFLRGGLNPALSLTSNIGGAYLLVPGEISRAAATVKRDRLGSSIPARMAAYTTKLLAVDGLAISVLPREFQVELLYLLYLVAELGSDQIAVADARSLWGDLSDPWAQSAAEDAITEIRSTLVGVVGALDDASIQALIGTMLHQTKQLTPLAVYTARALSELVQVRQEGRGFSAANEDALAKRNLWKASPESALGALAFLSGYNELLASSKSVSNFCNRLISDVAGATPAKKESTLATLVLLNACMAVYEVGKLPAATNRLVFAVKQITSWFGNAENDDDDEEQEKEKPLLDARIATESCRALQRLLPCIKDIYGPYWERSLKFCIGLWDRAARDAVAIDEHLPYIHASLKLVAAIEAVEDPNDDLEDAIALFSEAKFRGLRRLLLALAGRDLTQPQEVVDRLLARMAGKTPLSQLKDLSDLYGLVASPSRDIQAAGFGFLHRALPVQQSELSLDVILEKKEGRLPDELLPLLLDAPTLEAYPDDVLAAFPTPVRAYLLSWRLVFDAFSTASAKVRGDYADHLGKGRHVAALLDFTFDVLGHSAARPLNLERAQMTAADITAYDLAAGDALPDERHMQALLVHLYYLTLKYVPGLFKAWYAACRSKQTTVAVEAWTTKYVSALVVDDVLDEVAAWAAAQEPEGNGGGEDEKELIVKVSKRAREVVAAYEVDELQMSIALRLPANYPIDHVAVVGLNRVAVDERKWQSWLMITQGVIAFSNGSVVEGLATFRRNVLGALRGQTECAICYSIVSADRRMPDKRCATCKNLFHRTCLYKWFQSSNQNSCPLCRNPISFLGSDTRARRSHADAGFV